MTARKPAPPGSGELKTYPTSGPGAAETEPPACPSSLDLIEFSRASPVPIRGDRAAAHELRGRAAAEPDRARLRRGQPRAIPGTTKSAASTASANTNSAAMTHLAVRAEAERGRLHDRTSAARLRAQTLPRSSDTGVEAAARLAVSPPISPPAIHGRKAARGSGRAIPTAIRPPTQLVAVPPNDRSAAKASSTFTV